MHTQTLQQYYAWWACVDGGGDDDIECMIVRVCRSHSIEPRVFAGRLLAVNVVDRGPLAVGRTDLVLALSRPPLVQQLVLDLRDPLTQSLLRKLAQIDPTQEVRIEMWIPDEQPWPNSESDNRFATVCQGRYCNDPWIAEPWRAGSPVTMSDLERDPDAAARVVREVLRPLTFDWHRGLANKFARRLRALEIAYRADDACPVRPCDDELAREDGIGLDTMNPDNL